MQDYLSVLIHALLALVAGVVKDLNVAMKEGFKPVRMVCNGIVSSFVGVVIFFLCTSLNADTYLTAFFTSIGGWMGGNLMDFFSDVLKRYITRKLDDKSLLD
jgi:small basic protein